MVDRLIEQGDLRLTLRQRAVGSRCEVELSVQCAVSVVLHWGLRRPGDGRWQRPPAEDWPAGSTAVGEGALQTPLTAGATPLRLSLPADGPWASLAFVLWLPQRGQWLHQQGGDFVVPLHAPTAAGGPLAAAERARLVDEIVAHEQGRQSWTLMHRYQLCHGLLERSGADEEALAYLFVWLRFSALRQLDWQRRYNTKPRELAHAQQRLGERLAELYAVAPPARPLLRLLLSTVGAAGEGQRIRDEILEIMHRHRIKEVAGHFLEEWHQKLHNNTTPDDVVIAEAYLAFLRSDGDLAQYWSVLERQGVTRQRLESYERPIRSAPDFVPALKTGLVRDFEHFAGTLRALHEATDLAGAVAAAWEQCAAADRARLERLLAWSKAGALGQRAPGAAPAAPATDAARSLLQVVDDLTQVRRSLARQLAAGARRTALYLDLALEQFLRLAIERGLDAQATVAELVPLLERVLENLWLSGGSPELERCWRHWVRLAGDGALDADGALHARAVIERAVRVVGGEVDRVYALLQPKAEQLGRALSVEAWAISLFSEEVVRGRPAFVLAALLRHLDPLLRARAALGDWQVISPGRAEGELCCVDELRELQGRSLTRPLVVLARSVGGDEEIPGQVSAVITPMPTDLVSHVAVRARNAGLLFATCYAAERLSALAALQGQQVRLEVDARGDVVVLAAVGAARALTAARPALALPAVELGSEAWVLPLARCGPGRVGAKALGLQRLADALPPWVVVPPAVVVPFGAFERTLALPGNGGLAQQYVELTERLDAGPSNGALLALLARLRELVLGLEAPPLLQAELRAAFAAAGIGAPDDLAASWTQIKRVWASKWNERAQQARQHWRLAHREVHLAVLIQPLVPADHAFVVHTVNPATGDASELYAEIVPGLGETLVGNHPGRALAVVVDKGRLAEGQRALRVVAYPSKSAALSGQGLIYRSDANAEDLAGFAGAGLYDSVTAEAPVPRLLDYTEERLLWDAEQRAQLVGRVAAIGIALERAWGAPQDIEGVISEQRFHVVQARPQVGL